MAPHLCMGDTGASNVVGGMVIIAVFALTVSFVVILLLVWNKRNRFARILKIGSGLLLLPLSLLSGRLAYELAKQDIARRENDRRHPGTLVWAYNGDAVNALLTNFYREHPDLFTYPEHDETAESPDLLRFLASQPAFVSSGFSIRDKYLISPFGDKVAVAVDINGDQVLLVWHQVLRSPWNDQSRPCSILRFAPNVKGQQHFNDWKRLN